MKQLSYRIKDIEASPKGVVVDLPLPRALLQRALEGTDADLDKSSAHVDVRLRFQAGNVLCQGKIRGEALVPCQRCLTLARLSLDTPLNVTFAPQGSAELAHKHAPLPDDPFDPDDIDYAHHDREVVELDEVLREYIVLSLPITVLCKEDCQGLCPVCGVDRNQGPCNCPQAPVLSPFSVLKDLKV